MHTKLNKMTVDINSDERKQAKALAKSKGMTLQGWIGQLIKRELAQDERNHISEDLTPLEDLTKHGVTEILDSR